MHRSVAATALLACAALALGGCASMDSSEGPAAAGGESRASAELLTWQPLLTSGPSTLVMGTGDDDAMMCLGLIGLSLPPSCGSGTRLRGWDWGAHRGHFGEMGDRRWGSFRITGTYDASTRTFTVISSEPDDGTSAGEPSSAPSVDFSTPCVPPAGGWRVVDPVTTTDDTLHAALRRASSLEGYSIAWVDQPPMTREQIEAAESGEAATGPGPEQTILNVTVTGDTAAADAALREVWGGMLCVTRAQRTAVEYRKIQREIVEGLGSDMLVAGRDSIHEWIEVSVVHDDGTLQREYDEEYGRGVVRVVSALEPVA